MKNIRLLVAALVVAAVWACEPWDTLEQNAMIDGGTAGGGSGGATGGGSGGGLGGGTGGASGGGSGGSATGGGSGGATGGGTGGATDAGTTCSWQSPCSPPWVCDFPTGRCAPALSCSGAGRGSCAYGLQCANGTCATVPPGTCPGALSSGAASFDPTSANQVPIIFSIAPTTADVASCVPSTNAATVVVSAYVQPPATWPSGLTQVTNFRYVKADGSRIDPTVTLMRSSGYSVSGDVANFKVNFCAAAAGAFDVAFLFLGGSSGNGNVLCGNTGPTTPVP